MKRKTFITLIVVALLAVCGTVGLMAQTYTLTITSTYGFKYYGDTGSGVVYTPSYTFTRDAPFNVTLAPINTYFSTFGCGGISSLAGFWTNRYQLQKWTVNGTAVSASTTTVTVNAQQPAATATAGWQVAMTGDGYFNQGNGNVFWFCIPNGQVLTGENVTRYFVVNIPQPATSGYNFAGSIGYDANKLQVVSVTNNSAGYITMVDYATAGTIKFSGTGSGYSSELAITWKALSNGDVNLPITVTQFTDAAGNPATINGYAATGSAGTISIKNDLYYFGDVSGDGGITVIDALMVAQYSAGLRTSGSLELAAGDVNLDGTTNILDALIIARYVSGITTQLPVVPASK